VTKADQRLDQAGVRGVVYQRRPSRIEAQSEVGAEDDCGPSANLVRHAAMASLEPADRGTVNLDGSSHLGLWDPGSKSKQAEFLAEPSGGMPELAVARVERSPNGRL
jgi:hypothetical protein